MLKDLFVVGVRQDESNVITEYFGNGAFQPALDEAETYPSLNSARQEAARLQGSVQTGQVITLPVKITLTLA